MTTEASPDITPEAPVDVAGTPEAVETTEETPEVDPDEAEYQEAMRKLQGEKDKTKPETEEPEVQKETETSSEASESKDEANQKEEASPKVWKLKVNGEEVEFDASDETKTKQAVQKGLAADHKFAEAAELRKSAERFINALRESPLEVLSNPKVIPNFREIAEEFLYNELQRETNPEEYNRNQEKAELERLRRLEAERRQEEERRQQDELKERYRQDWSKKFADALETGGVPKTDWTVMRMAQYMKQAIAQGLKSVQPGDVVEYVKQDWINAQRQLFQHLPDEKLIEVVGKETADRIRKANLAMQQKAKAQASPQQAAPKSPTPSRSYGSKEEMMEAIRRGDI